VADELHLDDRLPARPDAKLASKPLVLDWLIAKDAGEHIVSEDLRFVRLHERSVITLGWVSPSSP